MLLLQIASFLPLFREAMTRRGNVDSSRVVELEPAELPTDSAATLDGLFHDVSREPSASELEQNLEFLARQRDYHFKKDDPSLAALTDLCDGTGKPVPSKCWWWCSTAADAELSMPPCSMS